MLVSLGVFTVLSFFIWIPVFLISLCLFGALALFSFRTIPADPPQIALLVYLGTRQVDTLLHEGYRFLFPGIEDLIFESISPSTNELQFPKIRCIATHAEEGTEKRSGGEVSAKVMVVYTPDTRTAEGFNRFINAGKRANADRQLLGMIGGSLRKLGGKKTWEEYTFSKGEASAELIEIVTGNRPASDSDEDVKKFLADAAGNGGITDIHDLGILIRRIEVIEVDPEGELEKDAEAEAREVQQRRGESADFDTEIMLAKKYVDESIINDKPTISLKEGLEMVRLRRNKNSTETIVRTSGNPVLDAAALFGGNKTTN